MQIVHVVFTCCEFSVARILRYQQKLTLWTYDLSSQGTDFCPGQNVSGVMTHEQTNHTDSPLLINLGLDPGEKYPEA